jgi:Na+/proline symporter
MGLSYLFEMTLNIQYETALYILTGLTAVYLVMGGYFAVAVSDFIRGIVEFAVVLIMVYLLAHRPESGGFLHATASLLSNPSAAPGLYAVKQLGTGGPLATTVTGAVTLCSLVLITSFGPWALPQMVQKFYSIRSKADVIRATVIAGIFSLFMSFGAYYSGALTHLFYGPKLPAELVVNKVPLWDKIMPHFITHSHLPTVLILLVVLMVFSASMSSLSSLVLVSSSAIAVDIYGAFVNRRANQKQTMLLMRVLCVVFVGCSLYIALGKITFIVNLMVMSWSTLAGVFLAPFLYGLFWKRATKVGVYAGIIVGLTCAFVLFVSPWGWGADGVPLAGAITMFLPLIIVPIVSLMTTPPDKKIIDAAFSDTADAELAKSEVVA